MKKLINPILLFGLLAFACTDSSETDYSTISGLWNCEEVDENSNIRYYSIDIDNVVNHDNVFIISNFHKAGNDLFIRVTVSDDELSVPKQAIGNYVVEGEGVISSGNREISIVYKADQGSGYKMYNSQLVR